MFMLGTVLYVQGNEIVEQCCAVTILKEPRISVLSGSPTARWCFCFCFEIVVMKEVSAILLRFLKLEKC